MTVAQLEGLAGPGQPTYMYSVPRSIIVYPEPALCHLRLRHPCRVGGGVWYCRWYFGYKRPLLSVGQVQSHECDLDSIQLQLAAGVAIAVGAASHLVVARKAGPFVSSLTSHLPSSLRPIRGRPSRKVLWRG